MGNFRDTFPVTLALRPSRGRTKDMKTASNEAPKGHQEGFPTLDVLAREAFCAAPFANLAIRDMLRSEVF